MGRSIGTGAAVLVASDKKFTPRAIILCSPYTDIRQVARDKIGSILTFKFKDKND